MPSEALRAATVIPRICESIFWATAKPAVARVSPATAERLGLVAGEDVKAGGGLRCDGAARVGGAGGAA